MRGEHGMHPFLQLQVLGSSPQARGALLVRRARHHDAGIIPACAGSTMMDQYSGFSTGNHPRMRGEHRLVFHGVRLRWGSSPHARGAQQRAKSRFDELGIIPACAGSTTCQPN